MIGINNHAHIKPRRYHRFHQVIKTVVIEPTFDWQDYNKRFE